MKSITEYEKTLNSTLDLDLNSMNIFDCLKVMVLSSVHYQGSKVKCTGASDDIKALAASFEIKNLEFV